MSAKQLNDSKRSAKRPKGKNPKKILDSKVLARQEAPARLNAKIPDAEKVFVKHHGARAKKLIDSIVRAKAISALDAKYVDVKSGGSPPCAEVRDLQDQLVSLRQTARAAIGGSVVKTVLFYELNQTSAANAALATSVGITPTSSSEYSNFASLYDEVRVDKVTVKFIVRSIFATSATTAMVGAIGYDSTYNSAPASVSDVLESSQHMLFHLAPVIPNIYISPEPTTKDGLYSFSISIPRGPVANAATVTGGTGLIANFPGEWMAIGDTADSVGYVRTYLQNAGATNTIGTVAVYELHCSFRERT